MLSQKNTCAKRGQRNNEQVFGFEGYYKIARAVSRKDYYASWFPSTEDRLQIAALIACEAVTELGEVTTMSKLMTVIRRELWQHCRAWGMRKFHDPREKRQGVTNHETNFCCLAGDDGQTDYLEGKVGTAVGEYSRQAAKGLHKLVNLPDPETTCNPRKERQLALFRQALEIDQRLKELLAMYEATDRGGVTIVAKRHGMREDQLLFLIRRARKIVDNLEQGKPTRTSTTLSVAQNREQIVRMCQMFPDATNREIARKLGIIHKTVGHYRDEAITSGVLLSLKCSQVNSSRL